MVETILTFYGIYLVASMR